MVIIMHSHHYISTYCWRDQERRCLEAKLLVVLGALHQNNSLTPCFVTFNHVDNMYGWSYIKGSTIQYGYGASLSQVMWQLKEI